MKISEKQIMQLINIVHYHLVMISPHERFEESKKSIVTLIAEIEMQQSEELKVIE